MRAANGECQIRQRRVGASPTSRGFYFSRSRESRIADQRSAFRSRSDGRATNSYEESNFSWCNSRAVVCIALRSLVYARADNPEFVASAVSLTCKSTTWCRIRAFSEAFAPFPWCFFPSLNELELPEADRERKREGWGEGDSCQLDFPQNRRPRRNFVNGNARTSKFPIALLFL